MVTQETSPHMCRLRDLTYAAPIYVDVIYWKGDRRIRKRDLEIGMLPVMLRSNLCAFVTSHSEDNKSRTVVVANPLARKKGLYVKHSAFSELIPVSILMKAMGVQSDMEIVQMVGIQRKYLDTLMITLQECHERHIFSQKAALDFLAAKIKVKPGQERRRQQDPMDLISRQILSHVECPNQSLAPKIRCLAACTGHQMQ
eukprot:g28514.t1